MRHVEDPQLDLLQEIPQVVVVERQSALREDDTQTTQLKVSDPVGTDFISECLLRFPSVKQTTRQPDFFYTDDAFLSLFKTETYNQP